MLLISVFTKLLHLLPGELSHYLALNGLKLLYSTGILRIMMHSPDLKVNSKNRDLRHLSKKLGIAAGLDKNGDYIDCLSVLGIDFIEVGTVTPRPQKGNPKPRIFRDKKEKSLLNRLGFNNKGVDHLVKNLKSRESNIIVGSSVGKNFDTPNESAFEDYIHCIEKVYEYSDYIAVNISSPNTKDLRALSNEEHFSFLLHKIKNLQNILSIKYGYIPIFIKISPDEDKHNLKIICSSILENKLDGIICSNTTIDHHSKDGLGGLSGAPLKKKANDCLKEVRSLVGSKIPIIASGGVMSVADYLEKIDAGADHVQIYTGFIFEGPKLIKDIIQHSSN